jgi:hypothetical protein
VSTSLIRFDALCERLEALSREVGAMPEVGCIAASLKEIRSELCFGLVVGCDDLAGQAEEEEWADGWKGFEVGLVQEVQ